MKQTKLRSYKSYLSTFNRKQGEAFLEWLKKMLGASAVGSTYRD